MITHKTGDDENVTRKYNAMKTHREIHSCVLGINKLHCERIEATYQLLLKTEI